MNYTDLKNMTDLLKYREVVSKGPAFESKNSTIAKEELEKYSIDELKDKIYQFEHSEETKYTKELKNLVDKMFNKYGKDGDNMIAVWDANVVKRDIWEGEDPLSDIYWKGFEHKYNKLYYPICTNDENVPGEYYEDIDKLADILRNLKIKDAYDYWEDNNASLNEYWHGVIGIMKDYRVVAFVIRNDGILADEHGYENSENKIVRRFNL